MKKYFISVLFLYQSVFVYAQELTKTYYNKDWEETVEDSAMYYRLGEYSSGISDGPVTDYYFSGKVQMKGNYSYFSKHGEFVWYRENGNKKEEGYFDNGSYTLSSAWDENNIKVVKNGKGMNVWYYETGVKKSQGYYKYGKREGMFLFWDREGKLYEEDSCKAGNCRVLSFWDKDGNKTVSNGNGKYVSYYSNGTKKANGWYKDGKKIGKWTWYYVNGEIENTGEFDKDETRKGEWIWKYKNGDKYRSELYTDGVLNGVYFLWYPGGTLKERQEFKNGTPMETRKKYNTAGEELIQY